jgi:hypothetical protein
MNNFKMIKGFNVSLVQNEEPSDPTSLTGMFQVMMGVVAISYVPLVISLISGAS